MQEYFEEQKYTIGNEGEMKRIFQRTERTTFDRICMIFKKSDKSAVEHFLKTIHQRMRNMFCEDSLGRVRGEERDTRVGEINTYTDTNSIENDRALMESFGNPQDEENNKFNKPVERERPRTYQETFDQRDFPAMGKGTKA